MIFSGRVNGDKGIGTSITWVPGVCIIVLWLFPSINHIVHRFLVKLLLFLSDIYKWSKNSASQTQETATA